jgi:FKBP-type peptidyl-prolyl cis-trans isomerase
MQRLVLTIALLAMLAPTAALAEESAEAQELTNKEKVSYAVGMDVVKRLKLETLGLDPEYLAKGFEDQLLKNDPVVDPEEARAVLSEWFAKEQQRQQAQTQQEAAANMQAGAEFLRENKEKDAVKTTESGLQYKIVEQGDGPKPEAEDTVRVHYKGTLIDGTEFDSSYKRGQPAEFQVNGVIPGWTEALTMMPVGSKWVLYIPPNLAYGERRVSEHIGPNETLIFDIELLDIVGETTE